MRAWWQHTLIHVSGTVYYFILARNWKQKCSQTSEVHLKNKILSRYPCNMPNKSSPFDKVKLHLFPGVSQSSSVPHSTPCFTRPCHSDNTVKKVKLSLCQTMEAHTVVRRWDNRLTDGGKVVSLTHRPPYTPQEGSWYSFLLEAESTPGP
jgi:hypothetical protein